MKLRGNLKVMYLNLHKKFNMEYQIFQMLIFLLEIVKLEYQQFQKLMLKQSLIIIKKFHKKMER